MARIELGDAEAAEAVVAGVQCMVNEMDTVHGTNEHNFDVLVEAVDQLSAVIHYLLTKASEDTVP